MLNEKSQSEEALNDVFKALADPTRRQILGQLARGDAYVSELAEPYDMSLAAISRHVQILANAGLMDRVREGKSIRCRLNPAPMKEISAWADHYTQFWQQKFASFGQFVDEEKPE
ncbi:MAG: metalloregulator ArsR/SmtB family transcription factor [Sneathiella sp.]